MFRSTLALLCALVFSFVLFGCGGSKSAGTPTPVATEVPGETVPASEPALAVEPNPAKPKPAEPNTKSKLRTALGEVQNSIRASLFKRDTASNWVEIDVDPFELPDLDVCEIVLGCRELLGPDGKVLSPAGTEKDRALDFRSSRAEFKWRLREKGPETANLMVDIKVAHDPQEFIVKASDPATYKQQVGGVELEVTKLSSSKFRFRSSANEIRVSTRDAKGKALRGMNTVRGEGSLTENYVGGTIDTLKVSAFTHVLRERTNMVIRIADIAFPEEPTAEVRTRALAERDRREPIEFVDQKTFEALAPDWFSEGEGETLDLGLRIALPGTTTGSWDVHWIGPDGLLPYSTAPSLAPSLTYSRPLLDRKDRGLEPVIGAVGAVALSMKSGARTIILTNPEPGSSKEVVAEIPDSKTRITATFDGNAVSYRFTEHEDQKVIRSTVYNEDHVPLEIGNATQVRMYRKTKRYWGVPQSLHVALYDGRVERMANFAMLKDPSQREVFNQASKRIEKIRTIQRLVMETSRALNARSSGDSSLHYAADLAGQHYLFKSRGDQPGGRIPIEIAHSDPDGAERFGYTPKPHLGYHFSVITTAISVPRKKGEAPTMVPKEMEGSEGSFEWSGGTFKAKATTKGPIVVASPVDPAMPTFFMGPRELRYVYHKVLNGVPLDVAPNVQSGNQTWVRSRVYQK